MEKIAQVKANYGDKKIIVDGGVNGKTIKNIRDAGADAVVVGSVAWKDDNLESNIRKLSKICE